MADNAIKHDHVSLIDLDCEACKEERKRAIAHGKKLRKFYGG